MLSLKNQIYHFINILKSLKVFLKKLKKKKRKTNIVKIKKKDQKKNISLLLEIIYLLPLVVIKMLKI